MSEQEPPADLFDLRMLPAWVKESPNEKRYEDFDGEEQSRSDRHDRHGGERREAGPRAPRRRTDARRDGRERDRGSPPRRPVAPKREENFAPLPPIELRFVPDARALENVLAQIKSGHLAYSVFSLSRM